MPRVKVKGVANPMDFPDDMDIEDIKAFLQKRFANMATSGESTVNLDHRKDTAQAYKPTLSEKIGQGIASTLQSTGIISDNYGAQRIGENLVMVGEVLPGIGDATAGDEFGSALAGGDGVGMALGALGAIPLVGDAAKKAAKSLEAEFIRGMPLFHGTNKNIEAFELSRGGATSGSPVGKLGVSVALDENLANEYAELASKAGGSPTVIKLVHRAKNPVSLTLDGTESNMEIAATVADAWDNGKDAIMFKNYTSPNGKKGQTFILVKDPSQLRKPEAKFDPKERMNPNLLAAIGGLSIVGVASNQEEDDELN